MRVEGVIRLSKASYRKMVQNLVWGAGYNVAAIPLAAGVLAFAGFTLSPAVGALLMSLSTIVVAANAQLLRRVDLRPEAIGVGTSPETPERTDLRSGGDREADAPSAVRPGPPLTARRVT